MNEFLLIFRRDLVGQEVPSPAQLQAMMKQWQDWMGGIAAQKKLANPGNRLASAGNVIRPEGITAGPLLGGQPGIGGYIVIHAESMAEAAEISKGCPVLLVGGNVEIRPVVAMHV